MLSNPIFEKKKEKKRYTEKDKNLFLSIEGVSLSKSKSKQLTLIFGKSKFLTKEKMKKLQLLLNKDRKKGIQMLRKLMLPLAKAKKIMELLIKSGLNRMEIKLVLNFLKNLLKNLFKKPFDIDSISCLMSIWSKIPAEIKRLIVAIIELKKEILHKFMLDLQKNQKRIQKLNRKIGMIRNISSNIAEKSGMPIELELIQGNAKKKKKKGEMLNIEDKI